MLPPSKKAPNERCLTKIRALQIFVLLQRWDHSEFKKWGFIVTETFGKLESQVCLLEDALINNEIKMADEEYHPAKSGACGST